MATIASRDLRNHTRQVLDRVAAGDVVTITVNGEPVAEMRSPEAKRPTSMGRDELVELLRRQGPDPQLAVDLAWVSEGSTDALGPIR